MHERQENANVCLQLIGRKLRSEMAALCSNRANSVLRDQSAAALTGFTWGKLHDEMTNKAPTIASTARILHLHKKASCQPYGSSRDVCGLAVEVSFPQDVPCSKDNCPHFVRRPLRETGK